MVASISNEFDIKLNLVECVLNRMDHITHVKFPPKSLEICYKEVAKFSLFAIFQNG